MLARQYQAHGIWTFLDLVLFPRYIFNKNLHHCPFINEKCVMKKNIVKGLMLWHMWIYLTSLLLEVPDLVCNDSQPVTSIGSDEFIWLGTQKNMTGDVEEVYYNTI